MESAPAVATFASTYPPLRPEGRPADAHARGISESVRQVVEQLNDARTLRCQKSALFTPFEKRMFDDTFKHTEDALSQVAALAKRSRPDHEVGSGGMSDRDRLPSMLRSPPHIQASLTRLGIASQGLNSTLIQLNSRDARPNTYPTPTPTPQSSPPLHQEGIKPPPSYEESAFFSEGRRRNMQRRASAMAIIDLPLENERARRISSQSLPTPRIPQVPELSIPELVGDEHYMSTSSVRFSPDMSIPEVVMPPDQRYLNVELEQKFGTSSRPESLNVRSSKDLRPTTPLSRLVHGSRKTGRARSQSWLEARALE